MWVYHIHQIWQNILNYYGLTFYQINNWSILFLVFFTIFYYKHNKIKIEIRFKKKFNKSIYLMK